MAGIILERVIVTYPSQSSPALGPLDLTIQEGECVFVTGPNGSGKTTLARVLSGVIRPTSGRISTTKGDDVVDWRPGSVGWVQENPLTQMVGATVSEDISLGPRWLSDTLEEVRCKTTAALNQFELGSMQERTITSLSGGWQHQVALAAVYAQDPRIIILDEPETALDSRGIQRLMQWIHRLQQRGTILLILGHSPRWVSLADRVVVLDHGIPVPIEDSVTDTDQEWDRFVGGLFGPIPRARSVGEVSEHIWPG